MLTVTCFEWQSQHSPLLEVDVKGLCMLEDLPPREGVLPRPLVDATAGPPLLHTINHNAL